MEKVFNKKLKKLIDNHKVISFDIFDTLIKRNCYNPVDIFKIVEEIYKKRYGKSINSFHLKRVEAELKARNESKDEEIDINEIYNCLKSDFADLENIKQIEFECEINLCQKNFFMYDIYKYCKKNNKKIICISDMYLPEDIIRKILNNNGYDIKDIYISSSYKKTKLTGNLFKCALKNNDINKKIVLHIGDSWKADFISPLKLGIKAFHIKKKRNNCKFLLFNNNDIDIMKKNINVNIISSFINNNVNTLINDYEKFGFEIIGPFCLMFASWINEKAKEKNIDNLLFCSRDMKMIQKIYNIFYGAEIKNTYFYVSRKSLYLPYLYLNNNFKTFSKLIPKGKRKFTVKELLDVYNISINEKVLKNSLNSLNINNESLDLNNIENINIIEKLYNRTLKNYINKEGKLQYELFVNYLNNLELSNNTAIVDLGWRGTTQNIMIEILNNNLYGMYLGLHSLNGDNLKDNYYTYLFNNDKDEYSDKLYPIMAICELTLSALHGSTLKYSSARNSPFILGESPNRENEFIINIQNGAISFCKKIIKLKDYFQNQDDMFFADKYINVGLKPSYNQAKVIGDIYTENIKIRKLCDYKGFFYYILHFKQLKRDFIDSEWKIGFLKRFFKLPLQYHKIYNFLKLKVGDKQ